MNDPNRDAILRRIRSLLRLARNKAATPSEAGNAAARAQELMDRYQLTADALEDVSGERPIDSGETGGPPLASERGVWMQVLAANLAKLHGCYVYLSNRGRGRYTRRAKTIEIIGRPSDVRLVRELYRFLVREIDGLVVRKLGAGSVFESGFRAGAAETICVRLRDARRVVASEVDPTGRALVAIDTRASEARALAGHQPEGDGYRRMGGRVGGIFELGFELGRIAGADARLAAPRELAGGAAGRLGKPGAGAVQSSGKPNGGRS